MVIKTSSYNLLGPYLDALSKFNKALLTFSSFDFHDTSERNLGFPKFQTFLPDLPSLSFLLSGGTLPGVILSSLFSSLHFVALNFTQALKTNHVTSHLLI